MREERESEQETEGRKGERKGGEKPRRTLRGPETTAGKKRAKRKRENPTRALPLPYLALLASPRLSSPSSLPCLASPRLGCACQLATRRQTRPSLSFVLMPTRLHASTVFSVVVFLFTLANPNPRSLPPRRLLSPLQSRLSLPRSLAREPFRSPAAPRLIRTRVRT